MKKYTLTIVGIIISIIVYVSTLIFNLDLFERLVGALASIEKYEIDELIIPAFVVLLLAFIDLRRRQKEKDVEEEKGKIYKAMLFSTEHILNNFLNEMQVFKMTAEDTKDFDPEILGLYDEVIKESTTQIDALGNITHINESAIHEAVRPH